MMEKTQGIPLLTRGQNYKFGDIVDAYMAQYTGRDGTLMSRIAPFVEQLGEKFAHEIDPDHVLDVLEAIQARGRLKNHGGRTLGAKAIPTGEPLALSTLNRYRAAMSSILSWAKKKRLMPKGWTNPVSEIEQNPENNGRVRYLSPDEYNRLLAVSKLSPWPKLRGLIMLAVTTGARRGSLLSLKWSDVDLEMGRAYIDRTKNDSAFTLALLPEVVSELRKLKGAASEDQFVFCGRKSNKPAAFNYAWQAALKDARIVGACFHTLRHTHASWLAQNGAQLLEIAESMNHKSITMTKRYAHLCVGHRAEMLNRIFTRAQFEQGGSRV